ncbi:SRPBCC family protein [Arsenicicoccus dermatophilus]|uniref:SRPBCC family protein n=1 Tax=Arsenicicoccus dermatophilus TaxID=1076331 RepID=UPI001F4CC72D|nr:SRPBCC family protein [Arsenicicoccus dermatophilus]
MSITASCESSATTAQLWAKVGDFAQWGTVLPTVMAVRPVDKAQGVGAHLQVIRYGKAPDVHEITAWQDGASFTWRRGGRLATTTTYRVEAVGPGSRLEITRSWSGDGAALVALASAGSARADLEAQAFAFVAAATGA